MEETIASRELTIERKHFSIELRQNERGRFLKITEFADDRRLSIRDRLALFAGKVGRDLDQDRRRIGESEPAARRLHRLPKVFARCPRNVGAPATSALQEVGATGLAPRECAPDIQLRRSANLHARGIGRRKRRGERALAGGAVTVASPDGPGGSTVAVVARFGP